MNKTNRLFEIFSHMYSSQFASLYLKGSDQKNEKDLQAAISVWSTEVEGLSVEQITRGIDKLKKHDEFIPSIARFIKLATDIETKDDCVYKCIKGDEAVMGVLCHKIWRSISSFDRKSMTQDRLQRTIKDRYEKLYPEALDDLTGVELGDNVGALGYQAAQRLSLECNESELIEAPNTSKCNLKMDGKEHLSTKKEGREFLVAMKKSLKTI